jgi:hypothetical protein
MKIQFRNQLRAVPFLLFCGIFLLVAIWMLSFAPFMTKFLSISYCVILLPVLFLHGEYFFEDYGKVVNISKKSISLYRHGQLIAEYQREQLLKIIVYKSRNIDESGIIQFPTEYYFYARFIPINKGHQEIRVTCLMTRSRLDEIYDIDHVPVEILLTPFASLKWPLVIAKTKGFR